MSGWREVEVDLGEGGSGGCRFAGGEEGVKRSEVGGKRSGWEWADGF